MKRTWFMSIMTVSLTLTAVVADVELQQKTQMNLPGVMGKVAGIFGGKAANEGITSTVSVVGNRKMTVTENQAELIDLDEEKVYNIDLKKKTYQVTTFEEIRKRFQEAIDQTRSEQGEVESQQEEEEESADQEKEFEIDLDLKETGQTRTIHGFDTREVVMTVTVREKGKSIEEGGGMLLISNMWLSEEGEEAREVAEFDRRYAQALYGTLAAPENSAQMMSSLAMYPGMKDALEKFQSEKVNMEGTPILTVTTMEAVASREEIENPGANQNEKESTPTSIGGLLGGFSKKFGKKKKDSDASEAPGRNKVMTITNEILSLKPDVSAEAVTIPADFKQKN